MRAKRIIIFCILSVFPFSCKLIDEFKQKPELTPLEQGFRASAAIGYCASLASTAFSGGSLPNNVVFDPTTKDGYTGAGILYVNVDESNPIPFNNQIGDVVIAGLWDGNSGVISILFSDIDIINSQFELIGIYTVPVFKDPNSEDLIVVFAEQDIVVGDGEDTVINLDLSKAKFDIELQRSQSSPFPDPFVAVQQNFWHITIDKNNTASDFYDDKFKVSGGGQIVEARSTSGGVLYHAMIETRFSYNNCSLNPTSGSAFIQNLKVGSSIDLGNITLDFHNTCDGKADVIIATGKYIASNGKRISLGWN